jgi:hypothetical protein
MMIQCYLGMFSFLLFLFLVFWSNRDACVNVVSYHSLSIMLMQMQFIRF